MMPDRFLKGLLLLLLPLHTMAQALLLPDTLTPVMNKEPRWVVKFAPLALFDVDNTIQFGAERLLKGRHWIQGEFGYGWKNLNMYQGRRNDYENFEIWRGRAEWRRYSKRYRGFRRPHFASPPIGRYFAIETFFKQLTALEDKTVGRECVDGTCAYFERGIFPVYRTVWGVHCKFGRQYVLTMPGDNRFLLDFFVGFGFRNLSPFRYNTSINSDVVWFDDTLGIWNNRQGGLRPSATLGIKLGYVL